MAEYRGQELQDKLAEAGLSDWKGGSDSITAKYLTGDFATGLDLVNRLGAAAEEANHHPDITLTYPVVEVVLTSHDTGAVTERDLTLAATFSDIAAGADISADRNGQSS
ncbi:MULTISPECIES: 4a-hydroxytetrahydrobiopterin dehydratase [Brevibacterium]|uniref:Putative pterin-4-alpha-carbinolamine dehydratase n=1 Tax=Brevibacterium casei TaxID=33889 RepID=A0A7T3ZZT9_9MICO|nr:4a-hydroxytetrahydrobiopterin dehydratase [Brevibacterium casei]QQB14638.1 4a-hydroxytetrahydrobiopterin dehydratase [Brevibacterium casei]